ncbi:MAG: DNA-directed RNA polymerase subunit H [Candidatus Nanoarchaeia archaeon]|nr:DNA-directed RNA polymerase subunit H [Candidatus Nanoarchaeia archaeon]
MKEEKKDKFDITTHSLVPEHIKLTEEEKKQLLQSYNISIKQFPAISQDDAMAKKLNLKIGDVIKIVRKSPTLGQSTYYRVVIK